MGIEPKDARLFMVTDARWKFMHAEGGLPPMLFDLNADPEEFFDLGTSPDHADIIALMYARLGQWGRRMSQRVTRSHADIMMMRKGSGGKGILLGVHEADEVDPALSVKYRGNVPN